MRRADLWTLAVRATERLRPQFVDAGVVRQTSAGDWPAEVIADPDRLTQVLMNLLGNALAATPPGGSVDEGIFLGRRRLLHAAVECFVTRTFDGRNESVGGAEKGSTDE